MRLHSSQSEKSSGTVVFPRSWSSWFADRVSEQVVAIIRLLDSPLAIVVFGWSRRCFERLRDRLVVAIQAPEQNDPLLGLLQLAVTSFQEGNTLLIMRELFLQTNLDVLQFTNDPLQLGQGLLDGQHFTR